MKVLALTPYPIEAACTRFRLEQLRPALSEQGIELAVRPFLGRETYRTLYDRRSAPRTALGLAAGTVRRLADLGRAPGADLVVVQREAMIFGPPLMERLAQVIGRCPIVLDLDDPTWMGYDSPTYGKVGRWLKWPGKALELIDRSAGVTCGSRFVAEFVRGRGRPATVVPTVVDTDRYRPPPLARAPAPAGLPVVGWVGTHSTYPYLATILPALAEVARRFPFRLRVVGSGRVDVVVPGISVDNLAWSLEREPQDFARLDVGLYPITDSPWARGKSGLKSVQYMACGVPFVVSPVGAAAGVGRAGSTHLTATTPEAWTAALTDLLGQRDRRVTMGAAGRAHALEHYTVAGAADRFAGALRAALR
jgi:glycosyltransferase involved in cell wall biosynthesis